jgi:hypothetical protein
MPESTDVFGQHGQRIRDTGCPLCRFCAAGAFDGDACMLDGLPAWTAHLEYQESLSGPLLVKHCMKVLCLLLLGVQDPPEVVRFTIL